MESIWNRIVYSRLAGNLSAFSRWHGRIGSNIILLHIVSIIIIAIFFMPFLLQVGRYCSTSSPGPVVSLQKVALGLRVNFYTDNANVSSGFMGQYTFFEEKSAFGGKNIKPSLRKENKIRVFIYKNRVKNYRKSFEIPTLL